MKQVRVSKAEWLEKALDVLEVAGVNGVKVDVLAKQLNVSRSGFYWHFKDRAELLSEVLEYWKHEYTEVVIAGGGEMEHIPPHDRMLQIMKMIKEYDLDRFEVPMRAWADHDADAANVVNAVYAMRFEYISSIFAEMGFTGTDLEMRVRLWLCYATHGKAMFGKVSGRKQTELLKRCHQVLVCKVEE
jgi:AcrR family transcriptional regulator